MNQGKNGEAIREELRAELEQTRLAYHHLLESLDDEVLNLPSVNPAWNISQLLYHITTAHQFLPQDVRIFRGGWMLQPPVWLFDFVNTWFTRINGRKRDRRTLANIYDRRHQTVIKLLDGIKDEEWEIKLDEAETKGFLGGGKQTLAEMFHYLTEHFNEHEADIRESLIRFDR